MSDFKKLGTSLLPMNPKAHRRVRDDNRYMAGILLITREKESWAVIDYLRQEGWEVET